MFRSVSCFSAGCRCVGCNVSVVFQGLGFNAAPGLFKNVERLVVLIPLAPRHKIIGIHLTELREQQTFDPASGSVFKKGVNHRRTLFVESIRFLLSTKFALDLGFDREISGHKIELLRYMSVSFNSLVDGFQRVLKISKMLIGAGEDASSLGDTAPVVQLCRFMHRVGVISYRFRSDSPCLHRLVLGRREFGRRALFRAGRSESWLERRGRVLPDIGAGCEGHRSLS